MNPHSDPIRRRMLERRALRFVENLKLPDGRTIGDGFETDPWLRDDVLNPILARDDYGLPVHKLCYVELPRGHAKSAIAAAVALAEALLHASTDVVVAAADLEQAGVVGDHIDGFLQRADDIRVHVHQSGDEYRIGANSRIRLIASDAPSAWGLGGSHKRFRVIADELTNWKDDAMWIALASATGKTDDAQTLVFTNAGTGRGTSWQWRVRESARHEPWAHLFSAKGTIASWVGKQWIAQMRALLPPAAFARAIENVWAAESGDFVTAEQVRAIVDPDWKPVPLKAWSVNYTAGLDLGLRKDRSALAVVHVDDEQRVALDELQTWEGSAKRPVSIERVLDAVRDAKRRYGNLTVHADPWQFELAISQLRTSGVDVRPFTMSTKSVEQLSGAFYRLISERRLRLYPDVALENELLGLRVIQRPGGWRFDHGSGFSDRATALALAATKAECSGSGSSSMPALHAPPAGVLSRSGVIGDEAGRYFDPRPHPPQISEAAYQYFRSIVGR